MSTFGRRPGNRIVEGLPGTAADARVVRFKHEICLGRCPGHDFDVTVNFLAKITTSRNVASSCPPPPFCFLLKTKRLAAVRGQGPRWARICTTKQVRKRRPEVNYALETTSFSRQNNEVAARKPSPVFRTRKKNARSASSKEENYGARRLVETQEEVLRKDALEEMFSASRKRFLAIAYSVLRNGDDAEDAVQEAFLSAYRHLRSFEGRSALKTWLTRIVLNAALMMRRKRKPSEARPLSESSTSHDDGWTENIPDSHPDPEMIHAERETLQFINNKLRKLKPVLRQAFTMTHYDDLSGAEACAMLGVSYGTFKARLFHARRKLLERTERALVTPIRRPSASSSESWKRRGLRGLGVLES